MTKDASLHAGHRERLRQKFLSDPKLLADHELLELLLYFALPRRDTNDLAHRLIEQYGSIERALGAAPDYLQLIDGVGPNTACLVSLVGEIARRYTSEQMTPTKEAPTFLTVGAVAHYLAPLFAGQERELAYVLFFDNGMHMIDCFPVGNGTASGVLLSVRRIAERAYSKQAAAAVLAHNHPGGDPDPSGEDVRVTVRLREALGLLEVPLLEHIIFGARNYAVVQIPEKEEEKKEVDRAASPLGKEKRFYRP